MTPQERQLIGQLFDRLVTLENSPRDGDAEAAIREGFRRAPNAAYALVQTVLVQDEALKAANARIQQYEQGGAAQAAEPPRGFLDSMRESIFGRDEPRGSVPRVPQAGAARAEARPDPSRSDPSRSDPWGQPQAYQQPAYQGGAPAPGYGYAPSGGGSSFLGTAAAAAAGVIGGSLLMSGIRSAMGAHQAGPFADAFGGLSGGERSPWGGSAGGSELSREAGYNDIGTQRTGAFDQAQQDRDDDDDADADELDNTDYASDAGFGGGDDTA